MLNRKPTIVRFCIVVACATTSFCADLSRDVVVTYAFVPKDRLSDAVKGKAEALAIEKTWRDASLAKKGPDSYPQTLSNKYSIVVFADVPARFAVFGKIGIPVENPTRPSVLNVNLSPGYSATYVVDGGGRPLITGIPAEPKPYKWIDFHAE